MRRGFRHSVTARRGGVAALAVLLVLALAAITYWRFAELDTASRATVIAALWALGIVALALLARGWRRR
jgi:hypothetical protein